MHEELTKIGRLPFPIFIEVNSAGEAQKHGIDPNGCPKLASDIREHCPGLRIEGIMSIPPAEISRACRQGHSIPALSSELRQLADRIGDRQLSLGMTADLEVAIAAGSTMIRVGTAIFGERSWTRLACSRRCFWAALYEVAAGSKTGRSTQEKICFAIDIGACRVQDFAEIARFPLHPTSKAQKSQSGWPDDDS